MINDESLDVDECILDNVGVKKKKNLYELRGSVLEKISELKRKLQSLGVQVGPGRRSKQKQKNSEEKKEEVDNIYKEINKLEIDVRVINNQMKKI